MPCTVLEPESSVLVSLQKCPALTVSRLVKASPSNCVTSQMEINTTCSFSCPQGYQLKGPSYKKCESSDQWTDNTTNVSCAGGFNLSLNKLND